MDKDNIKAIIFDMDGVIVDTEPIYEKAEVDVCCEFNMDVLRSEWDNFRGKKIDDIFSYVIQKYGNGSESIEKMVERKADLYLLHALRDAELVDGILDFLVNIKNNSRYNYALTTSGSREQQNKVLEKFELSNFFDVMVTSEDVRNGKPHPEPYLITAKKLDKKPSECLVIEDSDNGIISAKSAGCQTCGITTIFGYDHLKLAGADIVISHYSELVDILFN